jgi:hypothetical protein
MVSRLTVSPSWVRSRFRDSMRMLVGPVRRQTVAEVDLVAGVMVVEGMNIIIF